MKKFKTLQELFADEKRWCKKSFAITKTGRTCDTTSRQAAAFCLSGAISLIYRGQPQHKIRGRLNRLSGGNFVTFNDDPQTTIKDIQRLVKKAGV